MTWIEQNLILAVVVFSTLAATIGYFYRVRTEKRENLREALYLLLEIWHRMTIVSYQSFDQWFQLLEERLCILIPEIQSSEDQLESIKDHFSPILQRVLKGHALRDFPGFQDAYKNVVQLIARSNPVYAYRVGSVSRTNLRLAFIDEYLTEAFAPLDAEGGEIAHLSEKLKGSVQSLVNEDETSDLERDILGLALRISIWTFLSVVLEIRRRHKKLLELPTEQIDKAIKTILSPLFHESK